VDRARDPSARSFRSLSARPTSRANPEKKRTGPLSMPRALETGKQC
jgi:hypothetical protein